MMKGILRVIFCCGVSKQIQVQVPEENGQSNKIRFSMNILQKISPEKYSTGTGGLTCFLDKQVGEDLAMQNCCMKDRCIQDGEN